MLVSVSKMSIFLPFENILSSLLSPLPSQPLLCSHFINSVFPLPEPLLSTVTSQSLDLVMHVVELPDSEGVLQVPELVGIHTQVKVGHHPRHIFTEQIVVGGVDVADTPVGVVVAVGAGAE